MRGFCSLFLTVALALTLPGCTKKAPSGKTFWIYTSIYKDVIAEMEGPLQKKFPDVSFQWFQSGSENVAARINAELSTGKSQADIVMTSDPFWYVEAKKGGHLLPYVSPAAGAISADLKDPDNAFVTVRICTSVIAYNSLAVKEAEAPKSWADLQQPKWKDKISMGSPMESGTAVLTAAQLARAKGWGFFEALRKNDLLAAGGNSAVITRLETQERPVGIVLLENVLESQRRKSPVVAVYPTEGVVLVPSPIAILAKTKDPDLSRQVYDFLLSSEMQTAILHGRMFSPILVDKAPDGTKPLNEILKTSFPWNPSLLEAMYTDRDATKKKFVETVLN